MLLFNIVLFLALLAFIGQGLKDGFIYSLGRIVGAVIGFLAARAWYVGISIIFTPFMPVAWAKVLAFVLIFALASWLMGLIFKSLDKTYNFLARLPFMKSANNLLGAFLGLMIGIILIGGIIWIIKTFNLLPFLSTYLTNSIIAVWIYKAFTTLLWILL